MKSRPRQLQGPITTNINNTNGHSELKADTLNQSQAWKKRARPSCYWFIGSKWLSRWREKEFGKKKQTSTVSWNPSHSLSIVAIWHHSNQRIPFNFFTLIINQPNVHKVLSLTSIVFWDFRGEVAADLTRACRTSWPTSSLSSRSFSSSAELRRMRISGDAESIPNKDKRESIGTMTWQMCL